MPKTNRPAAPPPEQAQLQLTAQAHIDLEAGEASGSTLPRFRMVAYTGVPMRVAGWRHPVVLDLAGLAIPSQARPIRFGHDPLAGVGHSDTIRVENGQLAATGIISRDTPAAREVVASAKNGFPWQASVGAGVEEYEFVKEGQQVLVNGQSYTGPLNVIRKATLGEISFVDLGADGRTTASVAAQNGTPSGEPTPALTPPSTEPSMTLTPPVAGSPVHAITSDEVRAQALAETNRITAVRRLCAGRHAEIEAQAIRDGWDAQRTELEILRTSRPRTSGAGSHDGVSTQRMLEAACLMTAKLGGLERHYDEPTLTAAHERFRGSLSLQELLLEAAWANGYTGRNFRDTRSVLRYAFGHGIEAGWSTVDIGGILSNVANKFLLEGFFSVEQVWRNICAVRNVSDFKTVTSYRLIGKDQYELVAPGGEIKHGTLGNETYSNKADTYGLMLSIDRRDIINDDLSAITTVPRKLGRGSGLKINDVFWKAFLD
ncbi:MAG: hypothetical protein K1X57_20585, partial [Gemmataceae bacterium]|nr:hypothetical protein [Gemmataceae bacterium]